MFLNHFLILFSPDRDSDCKLFWAFRNMLFMAGTLRVNAATQKNSVPNVQHKWNPISITWFKQRVLFQLVCRCGLGRYEWKTLNANCVCQHQIHKHNTTTTRSTWIRRECSHFHSAGVMLERWTARWPQPFQHRVALLDPPTRQHSSPDRSTQKHQSAGNRECGRMCSRDFLCCVSCTTQQSVSGLS